MISAICASKLYKASKRKDKINAAFMHQSNSELVSQLASYLDEEYRDLAMPKDSNEPNRDVEETKESKQESSESADVDDLDMPESLNAGLPHDFSPADNLLTVDDADIATLSEDAAEPNGESSSEDSAPKAPEKSEPVEESEEIYGCTNILDRVEVIKGTLNNREDTTGVSRIHVKDNEMWIYYNDDTNLNNIMTNVIEYLNAAGYTDLEFNRLARSDNAMVFVINNVQEDIKPIEAVAKDTE